MAHRLLSRLALRAALYASHPYQMVWPSLGTHLRGVHRVGISFPPRPELGQIQFHLRSHPTTLYLLALFLIKNGFKPGTVALTCALLMSDIRLAGHSVLNTKDFPFACAYLLCTLYLWPKIKLLLQGQITWKLVTTGTVISLIPYLLRTPVLIHFLAWLSFVLFTLLFFPPTKTSAAKKVGLALLPFPVGALMLWCLWPAIWGRWSEWLDSFLSMSKFHWQGRVRFFGLDYQQDEVPFWYAFVWIPVIFQPLALPVVFAGLFSFSRSLGTELRNRLRHRISFTADFFPAAGPQNLALRLHLCIISRNCDHPSGHL